MMAATLSENEEIPGSYPAAPSGLSAAVLLAAPPAMVWARIESYIGRRFTTRETIWIVEGPGEWLAPLQPATVTATERWNGAGWTAETIPPSPRGGYMLPGCGPWRFVADVGGGNVPAAVNEAFRRLAEYYASVSTPRGVRQSTVDGIGSTEYDLTAISNAMVKSGAADLLRPYRRAA